MKVSVCVLCDRATVREGLLHILGAGVRLLGRPELPAPIECDLAILLDPEDIDEIAGDHKVSAILRLETGGGQIGKVEVGFTTDREVVDLSREILPYLPMSLPFRNATLNAYGDYVISVYYDENLIQEIPLVVEKQMPPGVTGGVDPSRV